MNRGALIVLEGCDKVGKTTQSKMLLNALKELSVPAELHVFPDRSTDIGKVIDNYLTSKGDYPPETIHLLFSANRWEVKNNLISKLEKGVTLIIDRYVASGAAFSSAYAKKDLTWCKSPDVGLPAPDRTFLLEVSLPELRLRSQFGHERLEKKEIQEEVAKNFRSLMDKDSWKIINAERNVEEIHAELLADTLTIVKNMKNNPIGKWQ